MPSVPRISVQAQLTLTILLAILVSWIGSSGVSNYLTCRELRSYRAIMLANPRLYANPIPEPRFGLREFLLGYPPRLPRAANEPPPGPRGGPPEREGRPRPRPADPRPPRERPADRRAPRPRGPEPQPLSSEQLEHQRTVAGATAFVALAIALLAGAWASRRFTRPLSALMRGAQAMTRGNLGHRFELHGQGEFAQLAATLNRMGTRVSEHIAQLEREAELRRHFTADLAHEFRTPLTTLKTMAGALETGLAEDPERRQRAARAISRTSDRLLRLVTDMLELAKLDLHELPLHRQPVDVRELAASCVQAHSDGARAAGIALHPVADGPPLMADADPDRLAQTLDNLLSNAISYAGPGAEVHVSCDGPAPVRLCVSDTGRGIPARHLPFICEPFYRADAVRSPGDKHSGLGLRIARALIEAHGGQLTITSAEGQGTAVTVTLSPVGPA